MRSKKRAQEAVTFARDNATEREAVTDMRKVMADALRRNMGLTTYEAVATELRQRIENGEFVEIIRERKPREATTQRMLEMEKSNIQVMLDGQGRHIPIVANDARQTVDAIAERQQLRLNDNQRTAVEQILTSRDQIIGLQGGAGTGKTTALSVLREAAEEEGYEVRGFAPTTRATKQLSESRIQSETLQKFIRRRQEAPTIIIGFSCWMRVHSPAHEIFTSSWRNSQPGKCAKRSTVLNSKAGSLKSSIQSKD